jgi:hypothetical protein
LNDEHQHLKRLRRKKKKSLSKQVLQQQQQQQQQQQHLQQQITDQQQQQQLQPTKIRPLKRRRPATFRATTIAPPFQSSSTAFAPFLTSSVGSTTTSPIATTSLLSNRTKEEARCKTLYTSIM